MARSVLALVIFFAGCEDTAAIRLGVVLPRRSEALLEDTECWRLEATRIDAGHGDVPYTNDGPDPFRLDLGILPPGTYDVTLTAVERPQYPTDCIGGEPRARATAKSVRAETGEDGEVPLLVLPFGRPAELPVPSWVEGWLEGRVGLAAATTVGPRRADHLEDTGWPRVVLAGGGVDPSADVLVYEPRAGRFTEAPPLACTRKGHAAVTVQLDEGERVLFIGGEGVCTTAGVEHDAAEYAELLDPVAGTTILFPLAVPVVHPLAVPDGLGAALVIGSTPIGSDPAEGVLQLFKAGDCPPVDDETDAPYCFIRSVARADPRLPVDGGVLASVLPGGRSPFVVAGGRDATGALLEGMTLLERDADRFDPCVDEATPAPVTGDHPVAAALQDGAGVLFAGSAADGGTRWYRQAFRTGEGCGALEGGTQGPLADARPGRSVATPLPDGQVLISGGDATGKIEVFLPSVGGSLELPGADAGPREGHVVVPLEDGSVMLAGGGPAPIEALLPREGGSGRLRWDPDIVFTPQLDVIVVMPGHADEESVRQLLRRGGYLDPNGHLVPAGPSGLADTIDPYNVIEFTADVDDNGVNVLVTTGDMRCERREDGPGGQPLTCDREDPALSERDELECVLEDYEVAPDACAVEELLRAAEVLGERLGDDRRDVPLAVLIAAGRDDCSSETGEVFDPTEVPLEERCATAADLLNPWDVAGALSSLRSDPALVTVMTFGGPVNPGERQACPGIFPTPRLAALSAALGDRGHHIDLCTERSAPLEQWRQLLNSTFGRRVCLPHRVAPDASCIVTWTASLPDGSHEAVRVPEGPKGWTVHVDEVEGSICPETGSWLEVSPLYEIPIGARVYYACQ